MHDAYNKETLNNVNEPLRHLIVELAAFLGIPPFLGLTLRGDNLSLWDEIQSRLWLRGNDHFLTLLNLYSSKELK